MIDVIRDDVDMDVDMTGGTGEDVTAEGSDGRSVRDAPPPGEVEGLPLSHEIQTPLNAILGNIELLLDGSAGPLSAEARNCLEDVQIAARTLTVCARRLLLLVQALGCRERAARQPVDLLALLRRRWPAQAPGDGGQAATPPAAVPLRADPGWLEVLADGIAELAGDAPMPPAPPAITITRGPSEGLLRLKLTSPALDPRAASPVQLALVEAVLRLHGGSLDRVLEGELTMVWPQERVLWSPPGAGRG